MSLRRLGNFLSPHIPQAFYPRLKSLYFFNRKSVSQVGQDFWVFGEVFNEKQNGYFVEIGSADGVTFSNTFLLEKRYNWLGVCIEASPSYFKQLQSIRTAICLDTCVDSKEDEVTFSSKGLFGGIIDEFTDNKSSSSIDKTTDLIRLKTRPLVSILEEVNAPRIIDYLSIDVEGAEDRILSEFPFDKYYFNCLTVERPKARLREVLHQNEYLLIKEIPELETFYIHKSFLEDYKRNVYEFWQKYRHS